MKCPTCGFENPKSYGPCQRCGKYLGAFSMQAPKQADTSARKPTFDFSKEISYTSRAREETSTHEDIAKKMKLYYLHGTREPNQRTLEVILKLMEGLRAKNPDTREIIEEAANYIHDQYRLRWVAIGTKSAKDGIFRYESLVGFRDEAMLARKRQTFKAEDFLQDARYKGWPISDYSKMYFEEDKPYSDGAESTFNRPALLKSKRHSPEDALEADYLDVHIFGPDKELIGWIETSGTITGKLPDVQTIKTIEIIASIVGAALVRARQ